ncbi:MAG: hypothetical protein BGO93_24305 [Mesorhizobium sp. 65-26]|nr:MAG: hypothetical protein BGO93_24305 [Mesorhizobium sp. 65-26]
MGRGLYRHSETIAMVRYEKNSMLLAKDEYDLRGYQPAFEKLPTHAEWVEWHRIHGSESLSQAEWEAWRQANGHD